MMHIQWHWLNLFMINVKTISARKTLWQCLLNQKSFQSMNSLGFHHRRSDIELYHRWYNLIVLYHWWYKMSKFQTYFSQWRHKPMYSRKKSLRQKNMKNLSILLKCRPIWDKPLYFRPKFDYVYPIGFKNTQQ